MVARLEECRHYVNLNPPKVCKIMAFMAAIMAVGLLFYILLGFRKGLSRDRLNLKPKLEPIATPECRM